MQTKNLIGLVAAGMLLAANSYADVQAKTACPPAMKTAMDAEFLSTVAGVPTSEITQCLGVREEIKVVVNVSNNALNSKNLINQQINNVKNIVENYEKYGMAAGEDGYQIVVVVHGVAGKFLLDGPVYDAKFGTAGGNDPTVNAVKYLLSKGVKIFMCQNTMHSNLYKTADLIPGVAEVPAGVTAVIDYGMRKWVVLT